MSLDPAPNGPPPVPTDEVGPIALSLSGGGYRAAAFHLGVMEVLDRVGLLPEVAALSTVSGGTIAGARLVSGRVKSQPEAFGDYFRRLHTFLLGTNVVEQSLRWLDQHPSAPRSVIVGAANVYAGDGCVGDVRFASVLAPQAPIPTEISFNATDFSTGLSFRFQRSRSGKAPMGNAENAIPNALTGDVRLADVVAASSCFPGAFEPLQVPSDLDLPSAVGVEPVALMDGGIYDNQGIDALLLCIDRLQRAGQKVGLIAISDTNQLQSGAFLPPQTDKKRSRGPTVRQVLTIGSITVALGVVAALVVAGQAIANRALLGPFALGSMGAAAILLAVLAVGVPLGWVWARGQVRQRLPTHFRSLWPFIKGLHVADLIDMIDIRLRSVLVMMTDVFMKRIRDLSMKRVFADPTFQGRRIAFLVYDLLRAEKSGLAVSERQVQIAQAANDMPTTLWASEEELKKLIACGQNTAVYKLLLYLEAHASRGELSARSSLVREQLRGIWNGLGADPFTLFDARLQGDDPAKATTEARETQKVA